MRAKYRCLEQLLNCYFHEHWLEESLTPKQVVAGYLNEWSSRDFPYLLFELSELLLCPEPVLRTEARAMGCHYYPPGDGMSYRRWFVALADQVASHIDTIAMIPSSPAHPAREFNPDIKP
jgi:hypothetical protein